MNYAPLKIGSLQASVPIIQGGMGIGISLSGLASAVANAGGIGIISGVQIGFREPDFREDPVKANLRAIESEIKKARALSPNGIIGMNFMSIDENYSKYVAKAVSCGIDLIISGAGLPLALPELTQGSKTCIAPIVSSVRACRLILQSWWKKHQRLPDAVVVEGPLAGGHLGFKLDDLNAGTNQSLEEIVPEVCAYVNDFAQQHGTHIPVIAAGGIRSHADMQRFMELGASGVQIGTLFVATKECDACDAYKQVYVDASASDVRIIKSPTGFAARAVNTPFCQTAYSSGIPIQHCFRCMPKICSPAVSPYCLSQALIDAVQDGSGLVFCGARVGEIQHISTAAEVIAQLLGK